ncbi:MAG: regulatory protein RecX [Moraxellaceae bacterium]
MPTTKRTSKSAFAPEDDPSSGQPSPEFLHGRALAMQARREHSRQEIRQKLLDLGGLPLVVDSLLDALVQRRLQSDERFAEIYIRSRAERGYGPRVIEAELRAKGLAAELQEQALAASGYDWLEQAQLVRQKRFGRVLPAEMRERARQMRFLQYRGFSGSHVSQALRCELPAED